MVTWYVPVFLNIVLAYGVFRYIQKNAVGLYSRTTRFFVQFLFAFLIATAFGIFQGTLTVTATTALIFGLGAINGFAAFCQWKAIHISLSKNSLFTFWDDIIAMSLAYFFLNEGAFLNLGVSAGIILSFCAIILFLVHAYRKSDDEKSAVGLMFFVYIGIYSVVLGCATFLMRYWALNRIPAGQFLFGWYGGALMTATLLLLFYREKDSGKTIAFRNLTLRQKSTLLLWSGALGTGIIYSLGLHYWAFQLAPLIVLQPIFLVAEMIIPALMGLFLFSEHKNLSWPEWIYFGISATGGLLVALNYH